MVFVSQYIATIYIYIYIDIIITLYNHINAHHDWPDNTSYNHTPFTTCLSDIRNYSPFPKSFGIGFTNVTSLVWPYHPWSEWSEVASPPGATFWFLRSLVNRFWISKAQSCTPETMVSTRGWGMYSKRSKRVVVMAALRRRGHHPPMQSGHQSGGLGLERCWWDLCLLSWWWKRWQWWWRGWWWRDDDDDNDDRVS